MATEPTREPSVSRRERKGGPPLFASSRTCAHAGGCPPGRFRVPLAGRYSTAGAELPDTTMLVLRTHEPGRSATGMLERTNQTFNFPSDHGAPGGTSCPADPVDPAWVRRAHL